MPEQINTGVSSQRNLFLAALSLFALIVLYAPTLIHIALICWRDDAYSHGLVLPLVMGYLLCERREDILRALRAPQARRSTIIGALCLVAGMFFFFVGEASNSLAAKWFSLFPTLVGGVLLTVSRRAASLILPPVLLLYLAKPLPDSLVPRLFSPFQNFAARVSASTLELLNVPVHVMGNVIEIPGMRLQVEEACSGMRSLMALLCVAVIVILMIPLSRLAQLFVVALSIAVALTLNVVRVAATGVLAHFVSAKSATGFFHTFSGMIVFLIGLAVVYVVTARLGAHSKQIAAAQTIPLTAASDGAPLQIFRSGLLLTLSVIALSSLGFFATRKHVGAERVLFDAPIEALPLEFGNWKGRNVEGLGIGPLDILKLSRYIRRVYTDQEGNEVLVYVGYWAKQSGEHQAAKHSPSICLPSNGWSIERLKKVAVETKSTEPLSVNRIIGGMAGRKLLFHYWFFSGEETYADEWQALIRISFETFFHNRSDGGIVELSTALKDPAQKDASLEAADLAVRRFTAEFAPQLAALLRDR